MLLRRSEALNQSLPFLTISLVNKLGSIGLTLLPILLVERQVPTLESSVIFFFVKASLIVGTLSSGWICDRLGLRRALVLALAALAIGIGGLPFMHGVVLVTLLAMMGQFGEALTWVSLRFVLTTTVNRNHHKEALGWVRTVNNFGQIFASFLGTVASGLGLTPLFLFDAFTSLAAMGFTFKSIPAAKQAPSSEPLSFKKVSKMLLHRPLMWIVIASFYWSLLYNFYMTGVAGKMEVVHPGEGLKLFMQLMLINTVLCTVLAVPATRFLSSPSKTLPLGLLSTLSGLVLAITFPRSEILLMVSAFAITLGEIALGALMQFTIIRLIPSGRQENVVYSTALTVNQIGKLLGATFAFPLIVHAENPMGVTAICIALGLVVNVGLYRHRAAYEAAIQ